MNIGREINSEFEDYAPVLNENEDEIVFTTRSREENLNQNVSDDNKPYEDIFTSKKNRQSLGVMQRTSAPGQHPYHESNLAMSADGNTLFILNDEGGGDILCTERAAGGESARQFLTRNYQLKL